MKFVRRVRWLGFLVIAVTALGWLIFGVAGWVSDALADRPLATRNMPIILVVPFFAGLLLIFGASFLRDARNRRIGSSGERAEAVILKVEDTGEFDDDAGGQVMHFWLEVRPSDRPHFEAEAERLVLRSERPQFEPGNIVDVMYEAGSKAVVLCEPKRRFP